MGFPSYKTDKLVITKFLIYKDELNVWGFQAIERTN